MFKWRVSAARLNHFDDQLDQLSSRRSLAPPDPHLDQSLVETARRLHALQDDSAPDPSVLAAIWEGLMDRANTVNHRSRALPPPLVPTARAGNFNQPGPWVQFEPVRRWRPMTAVATAAVIVLTVLAGYLALRLAPSSPQAAAPSQTRTALLLIVDTSGSMSYDPSGAAGSKIDLAREALRLTARTVAYGDHVGVLAFNDRHRWVVPMTAVATDADRVHIDEAIATLTAEGGTEIYPALALGFDAIRTVDADIRHVVVLSDGKSRTGTREDYRALVADVTADGVTLSTVAIGADADTALLQYLAEQGNGRYHFAETATDIPNMTRIAAMPGGTPAP